jgi:hypothetical protein
MRREERGERGEGRGETKTAEAQRRRERRRDNEEGKNGLTAEGAEDAETRREGRRRRGEGSRKGRILRCAAAALRMTQGGGCALGVSFWR